MKGVPLHVEVLEATMDFQSYFDELDVNMSGLAATHNEPHTNHSWQFVRRNVMEGMFGNAVQVDCFNEDWQEMEADPRDTIMVLKQYLHSTAASQPPLLVMPHSIAASLKPENLQTAPRNALGKSTIREFLKTACIIGRPPWNKVRGQTYLEELVGKNPDRVSLKEDSKIDFRFIFEHNIKVTNAHPLLGLPPIDNPVGLPREVRAIGLTSHEKRKKTRAMMVENTAFKEEEQEGDEGGRVEDAAATEEQEGGEGDDAAEHPAKRVNVAKRPAMLGCRKRPAGACLQPLRRLRRKQNPAASVFPAGVAGPASAPAAAIADVPGDAHVNIIPVDTAGTGVPLVDAPAVGLVEVMPADVPAPAAEPAAAPGPAAAPPPGSAPPPAVAAAPVVRYGCTKCRRKKFGCAQCKRWAQAGKRGYKIGVAGEIISE